MSWTYMTGDMAGAQWAAARREIWLAYAERANAVGYVPTSLPSVSLDSESPQNWLSWQGKLAENIVKLARLFIDHRIPGEWVPWFEPKLEAELGPQPDSPITSGYSYQAKAAWYEWHYRCLDLLRWHHRQIVATSSETRSGEGLSWAAAIADWEANPWVATEPSGAAHFAEEDAIPAPRDWYVYRTRSVFDIPATPLPRTYDLYIQFTGGEIGYHNDDYPGVARNDYPLMLSNATPTTSADSLLIGDFPTITVPDPVTFGIPVGWGTNRAELTEKFDGAGGFTYLT